MAKKTSFDKLMSQVNMGTLSIENTAPVPQPKIQTPAKEAAPSQADAPVTDSTRKKRADVVNVTVQLSQSSKMLLRTLVYKTGKRQWEIIEDALAEYAHNHHLN